MSEITQDCEPSPPTVLEIETETESFGKERCNLMECVSLSDLPAKILGNFSDEAAPSVSQNIYTVKDCGRLTGPLAILLLLTIVFLVLGREYLTQTLEWLEQLELIPSIGVFVALFTLVSFPFGFGYIILNLAAGYVYGIIKGQVVVSLSVAIGFTIAFAICRCCLRSWALRYVSKSSTLMALKSVVEGPNGIRVILLTRFTPIPFGLQNTLFAVSHMSHSCTFG